MDFFSEKYKRIAIISTFLFVVIASFVFLYIHFISNSTKTDSTQNNEQTMPEIYTGQPPAPVFSNWVEGEEGQVNTAQVNDQSSVYSFKTDYTPQEISKISSLLKVTAEPDTGGYMVFKNYSTESASLLLFKETDGSLSYSSTNGIGLTSTENRPNEIIEKITELGIYDSSIKVTASYRRKSKPGIQYYELHRDWKEIGYPIFNPVGLLNLPENELLHNLSFTTRDEYFKDTDIYDSSDQNNAYARKTDFNTMTIAVDEERNSIIYIESNIRPLTTANKVFSKSELLTKEEALEKLRNGEQSISLTTPAGEGAPDFLKVYPNNTAAGKDAVIEESIVVYLENVEENEAILEPYYIFRGYSELTSGYRVRFIAAVLAIKNNNIAGVSTIAQGQHQDTLTFPTASPVTPTQIKRPTQPKSTPTTQRTQSTPIVTAVNTRTPTQKLSPTLTVSTGGMCEPDARNALATYVFKGNTYVLLPTSKGEKVIGEKVFAEWYILPSKSLPESNNDIISLVDNFISFIQNNIKNIIIKTSGTSPTPIINQTSRSSAEMLIEFLKAGLNCPLRVSGISPSIFVYGSTGNSYTLISPQNLTYSEPATYTNRWDLKIQDNSKLVVDNQIRDYIYYEYELQQFKKPSDGWVIERKNLENFSNKIGNQLGLTSVEKERLLFELKHASFYITDPYLFIGVINKMELDEKVPLSIAPKIENMQRYHFYVEGLQSKESARHPILNRVVRTETMLLEFGAVKGN